MLIEKHSFEGGLDGDSSERLIAQNAMLNLMNAHLGISEYGRNFRIENLPGTTIITQGVMPIYGVSQCIGSCIDSARNRVIFFIWNSFGDHSIFCYDIAADTMYGVLYDSQVTDGLNFEKTSRINRECHVVGDMLYWTDNLNPPRRINIEAGIKLNLPAYSTTVTPYTFPLSQSVISWIRRPYGLPVTATKSTDGGFSGNFLALFAGQFASSLVYRDGEESVPSVPSAMINYNFPTDTYNKIAVVFPLSETFDQDVQVVQLMVRNDNSPDYFIIKEWDKANTTEAAEITAHNNGITALTFNFYNNKTGIAFGKANSVKPFDSIGLTVKTIEFATNRMFHANSVKGYGTPTTTSLAASLNTNVSDPATATALKCNSSYQIGVRFRDNSKRSSFVVTNAGSILNTPDRSYATVPYNSLDWALSNAAATTEIPDWAYYYDILITKNLRTNFFIQNYGVDIQYVKKNQDGTYTYQTTYDATAYAVGVNISILTGEGMGYVFNEGDQCRLYLGNTATVNDLSVIGQDGNYVLLKTANLGSFNPQPGCYFEIYTPYKPSDNETFYTTGQSYKITNPTLGSRVYSTTSGTITGDITRVKKTVNIIIAILTFRNEYMSTNYNEWQNWFQFYGESNIKSLLGQVAKINFVNWSNVKTIGASTNGLSTFDGLDEKAVPLELGEINKLQLTNKVSDLGQGNIMLAICATETASLYLGEVQVQGASQTAYIAESVGVIGSINVLNGSLGTANPESVVAYLGSVFWIDVNNGCYVQYSPNGLEPVSRYKMSRFFKNYSKDYLSASTGNLDNINGFHHIPGFVDPFHKEVGCGLPGLIYENYATNLPSYSSVPNYATSIINRFDIYDQLAKTMCFQYEENKWGSNMEYGGEWYDFVENKMFGWKNGYMYSMNTNTTNWNTFFGTQRPVRVCFTGNINPSLMKVLNNISIEGSDVPGFAVALTAVPNIQITDLAYIANSDVANWTEQEGVWYAYFLGDRIDPNSSGTADQKLFTGSPLRDFAIYCMLEFQSYSGLMYINFVNLGYSTSRGMSNLTNIVNK